MKIGFMTLILMMAGLSARAENIHPFNSDGCSGSPDAILGTSFIHCCIAHDFDYWIGGTEEQKEQADQTLKQCIQKTIPQHPRIALLYKLGVLAGGAPRFLGGIESPLTWRWGYGWEENHGYTPTTKEQLAASLVELKKLESSLDEHERALNETKGYAWRFRNLSISHEQFRQIRADLQKKIGTLSSILGESEK